MVGTSEARKRIRVPGGASVKDGLDIERDLLSGNGEEVSEPMLELIQLPPNREGRVPAIIEETAGYFGVSVREIMGRSRSKSVASARKEAMRKVRELGFSYPEIGRMFGRDHTTVVSACRGKNRRRR